MELSAAKKIDPQKINHEVPFEIFAKWFEEAKQNPKIVEPTAMCLSTCSSDLKPSSRMILLKKFDERGFCFFTNFNSRKAREIKQNQHVALCFYWGALGRQVRIEGAAEEVSKIEADEYFASRRRESRIGAWSSKQSQKMANWQEFEERINKFSQEFEGKEVPRPEFWSGYRVVPNLIEFWEEGDYRIHKRRVYTQLHQQQPCAGGAGGSDKAWQLNLIYP